MYQFTVKLEPSGATINDVRSRQGVEAFLINKEYRGYQNNCVFELNGNIEIKLKKVDDIRGKVSTITGTAKKLSPHDKSISQKNKVLS